MLKIHSNYHLVTAEPPFISKTTHWVHQTGTRKAL